MSHTHIFTSFLLMEGNSATFQNIYVLLSRIIEYINAENHMQE